jgi:PBP1b-binding outer membrane lipoprotein LpoB
MKSSFIFSVSLIAIIFSAGCASMNDVLNSKDEGTVQVYNVDFDQAWEIAKTVFRWEGTDAIEEHKDQNYMLTSSGANFISMGAVMGAWVEAVDQNNTKVTVVTKRRVSTNVATTLTESTFQKRFAQAVDIVKSGKPLPINPPN